MVPRLSALLVCLVLGMSMAHAQQNPLSDFFKDIFPETPETQRFQRLAQQPSPSVQTSDAYHIQRALGFALEVTSSGTETTWHNRSTGHHGAIIPSETFNTSTGQVCRKFERTLVVSSSVTRYEGTACRETSGAWTTRAETIVPATSVARAPSYSTPTVQPAPTSGRALTAEAQTLLTQLGYNPGPIDGLYGGRTQSAIQAFQQQQGLPVDGQISESLLAQLREVGSISGATLAARTDEWNSALTNALEELDWAVSAKINHDVEATARAFADAYDIEQSRRIADFVLAPLTVIEQTIGLLALVKRPSEVAAAMSQADGVLEVASILMAAGELLEVGENLQLAIDGPMYGSLAEAMLNAAATSSDPGEYAATVQLYLYGIGNRKSPIWARYRVGGKTEMVWGARAVKRRISDAIASLLEELSTTGVGSGAPIEDILGKLGEITIAIDRSKARNVPVPLGGALTAGTSAVTQTEIGSIGALEQARRIALKNYDSDLRLKQRAVITNAGKAGFEALLLNVGYETEAGQQLAEIHRTVVTPVSVAVGAVTKFYSTNARQEVNGLPYQMLIALPAELSNTWMLVDQSLSYIRSALQPPKVAVVQDTQPGTQTTEQAPPSQQTSVPIPESGKHTTVPDQPVKLRSGDVRDFEVYGLKLYMTYDEVLRTLQYRHPIGKITWRANTVCVRDMIAYINKGMRYRLKCPKTIKFFEQDQVGQRHFVSVGFVEDVPQRLGVGIVTGLTYEFRLGARSFESGKGSINYDQIESSLFEKYGKPNIIWDVAWAVGSELQNFGWGTRNPRYGLMVTPGDKIPIDRFQPHLSFKPDTQLFTLSLGDGGTSRQKEEQKKKLIEAATQTTTKPKF